MVITPRTPTPPNSSVTWFLGSLDPREPLVSISRKFQGCQWLKSSRHASSRPHARRSSPTRPRSSPAAPRPPPNNDPQLAQPRLGKVPTEALEDLLPPEPDLLCDEGVRRGHHHRTTPHTPRLGAPRQCRSNHLWPYFARPNKVSRGLEPEGPRRLPQNISHGRQHGLPRYDPTAHNE